MPELPEVETTRLDLEAHLIGKTIQNCKVFRRDLRFPIPNNLEKKLSGKKILAIRRRAKYLLFDIEGELVMMVHLGMSGTLTLSNPRAHVAKTHEHVWWEIDAKTRMVFRDPRRFGTVLCLPREEEKQHPLLAHLGIEPLSNAWNSKALDGMLSHRHTPIKTALMDQRLVVGVGNIYASESLFMAGIHPQTPARKALKRKDALVTSVVSVLQSALASGGSTLRDYVRSSGGSGYFQHYFSVYDRQGEPCNSCGIAIMRIVQSNRSSFFCPKCQPEIV